MSRYVAERGLRLSGWVLAGVVVALSGGCGPVPQSRIEFVQAVSEGAFGTEHETFFVDRDLESVLADLSRNVDACLAAGLSYGMRTGNTYETIYMDYHPTILRIGDDRAEITLQVQNEPTPRSSMPPNGYFVIAEDLQSVGARVRVDFYYPTIAGHYEDIAAAMREWTIGNPAECPDLDPL